MEVVGSIPADSTGNIFLVFLELDISPSSCVSLSAKTKKPHLFKKFNWKIRSASGGCGNDRPEMREIKTTIENKHAALFYCQANLLSHRGRRRSRAVSRRVYFGAVPAPSALLTVAPVLLQSLHALWPVPIHLPELVLRQGWHTNSKITFSFLFFSIFTKYSFSSSALKLQRFCLLLINHLVLFFVNAGNEVTLWPCLQSQHRNGKVTPCLFVSLSLSLSPTQSRFFGLEISVLVVFFV